MRSLLVTSLSLFLVLCYAGLGFAQIQEAKILVKGVSPDLQLVEPWYDAVSTALPNVGKGQKVWLQARGLSGADYNSSHIDTIISQSWIITNPPGGVATITHTDTVTFFVPDTTGTYHVSVSLTTNNGTTNAEIDINSAYWVGVGTIVGSGANSPECGDCHGDKAATWSQTGHSRIFSYNIDSSHYYTTACLSCHTVGYDTKETAVNGGFDDIATLLGWTIPPLQPGNWDAIKANYPTLAAKANVQCENCHGPGSLHMGDKDKIAVSLSAEMCGSCHGEQEFHWKSLQWNNSLHAHSTEEGEQVVYMNSKNCSRCHTAQGYLHETVDGNTSAAPYADVQPVACATCHDPHDASNPAQLRSSSIATACDGCHITRLSSYSGLHNSPQSPMLNGSKGTPYSGQPGSVGNWGGWQFAGYKYPNSSHSQITDRCAQCHMADVTEATLADTAFVSVPYSEWKGKLGGHTLKVVWKRDTTEANDVLNPLGCKECHGTVSLDFVRLTQAKTKTLLAQLYALLPKSASDSTVPKFPSDASLNPIQKAASYNWYFVTNDGSFGVHNYEYAAALVNSSIEMLKLGAGAASIASITDIPNDQGKQVQIVWNAFPAEKYPTDPVVNYLVLRQDSANALGKTSYSTAPSFKEMLSMVRGGSPVILAGSVWTKVGEYKALNLPKYSLVVPTLYDSTKTSGMMLTTFEVVGYTASNVLYASVPENGYSLDNLAPAAPGGLAATSGGGVANLTWNPSGDADFKYFAVYRGTTPNFVPSGNPLKTTAGTQFTDEGVQYGNTYYYKLTAFDFSGNESQFSNEIPVTVTTVTEGSGIPTEYALRQNSPNPFNPSTLIRYQLPEAAHVTIHIYSTLGMLVANLVDGEQEAGYHSVVWDGKDNTGKTVSSGIYLYKMEAGKFSSVKKMMLLK